MSENVKSYRITRRPDGRLEGIRNRDGYLLMFIDRSSFPGQEERYIEDYTEQENEAQRVLDALNEPTSLRPALQEAQEKLNRAYIDEVYQDNEIRELAESLETAMEILNVCEIDLKIRLNSLKAFGGGSGVERIEDTLSRISSFLHDGTKEKP